MARGGLPRFPACAWRAPGAGAERGIPVGAYVCAEAATVQRVRAELLAVGITTCGSVVTGKVWLGAVGSSVHHEHVVIGEPIAIGMQLARMGTQATPLLVDGWAHYATKAQHNYSRVPFTCHVDGQLRRFAVFALHETKAKQGGKGRGRGRALLVHAGGSAGPIMCC